MASRIPINFGRAAVPISTGAQAPGASFGQQAIQLTGAGRLALAGAAGVLAGTAGEIASDYGAREAAAEEASDMASAKARTDAVYRDAAEKAANTSDHKAIQKLYGDAHKHVGHILTKKDPNGVPMIRSRNGRRAFGNWLKGEKSRQDGIAMSRRVNLARQENAARFDRAEGDLIKTAGQLRGWETAEDAARGMSIVTGRQRALAASRVEAGLMTQSEAALHLEAQQVKAQEEFATQELARIYNSPLPPEALKLQLDNYKDTVDKVGTELTDLQKKQYFDGADRVLKMSAQQQKIRQQGIEDQRKAVQDKNVNDILQTMDATGNLGVTPQQLKSYDIPATKKEQWLRGMATDATKIKNDAKAQQSFFQINRRVRNYDPAADPDGSKKAQLWFDMQKNVPAELRTPLASQFNAMMEVDEGGNKEAVKQFGEALEQTLALHFEGKQKSKLYQEQKGLSYDRRAMMYGLMQDDFRRYASKHTAAETQDYAKKRLEPLQADENLAALYENYTRLPIETFKPKPGPELQPGEVLMRDKSTGKRYVIDKAAGTYREVE